MSLRFKRISWLTSGKDESGETVSLDHIGQLSRIKGQLAPLKVELRFVRSRFYVYYREMLQSDLDDMPKDQEEDTTGAEP